MRRNNRNNTVPVPAPPDPSPPSPPSTPPAAPVPPPTWAELFDIKLQLFLLKCKVFMYVNKYEFINGIYAVVVCVLSVYSFDTVYDFQKHIIKTVHGLIINSESITLHEGLFFILYFMVFIIIGICVHNSLKSILSPSLFDETKIFSDDDQGEKVRFCDGKTDVSLWAKTHDEHNLMLLGNQNDYNRQRKLKIRLRVSQIEKPSWYWKCIGFEDQHVEIVSLHREFDV